MAHCLISTSCAAREEGEQHQPPWKAVMQEEEAVNPRLLPSSSASSVTAASLATQLQGRFVKTPSTPRSRRARKGVTCLLVCGLFNFLFGCLTFMWTPFALFMTERLRMTPGLPPYDWWLSPPDSVFLRMYVFNVTNGPEFLNGTHSKLRFHEVGPIVFLEKLEHSNVTFNNNGTMTYTAKRTAIFRPELTDVGINDTLVLPNLAVLGIASYLYNTPFFTKFGLKLLMRRLDSQPFTTISVYNYLWNYTDALLHTSRKLVPFLVPVTNMGIINMIYRDLRDDATVYIGPGNGRRFFTMNRYNGSPRFGFRRDERCDAVEGATEGVTYPQFIERNDSLLYFRKTICRITPVRFVGDLVRDGLDTFRFELPDDFYDRAVHGEGAEDCYDGGQDIPLQSGLSDVSPCFYNFPIAASNPHFFNGDPSLRDAIEGMRPDRKRHVSYVIVEPVTGVPMESCARSQSNLVVRTLSGMPKHVQKFSDLVLPMFWAEYHQNGVPWYVYYMVYFTVLILPDLQTCVSFLTTVGGTLMLAAAIARVVSDRRTRAMDSYSSLDLIPSTSSSDC